MMVVAPSLSVGKTEAVLLRHPRPGDTQLGSLWYCGNPSGTRPQRWLLGLGEYGFPGNPNIFYSHK